MPKVLLGDVAHEHKETCKGSKEGYPIVGLEHLISGEITLTTWSEDSENSFTKMFRKGNVLFGRRRAYLKKAAVAPFDGICSGDITVIEAYPDKILPELLPFIIQNDDLFDFAVEKSAGSLSPRVKWEHLKNYEFELPDMEKQKELANILWAIDDTRKSYQELIAVTDELVKSQFMEQFANQRRERLGVYVEQVRGVSYKPKDLGSELDSNHITLLRANNVNSGMINFDELQYVDRNKVSDAQIIREGDILMCASSGSLEHVGKAALCKLQGEYTFGAFCKIIRPKGKLRSEYVVAFMNGYEYRHIIMELAQGSNINNLRNEHINDLMIPVPSDAEQEEFIKFMHQSDKSKFEIEQALSELTATYKRIIKENLG